MKFFLNIHKPKIKHFWRKLFNLLKTKDEKDVLFIECIIYYL